MKNYSSLGTTIIALIVISLGWAGAWGIWKGGEIALTSSGILQNFSRSNDNTAALQPINSTSPVLKATVVSTEPEKPKIKASHLTIRIGGDVMFDRGIRRLAQSAGYDAPLSGVTPLFSTADIAIANLEGPITTKPSKTLLANGKTSSELVFTFAPKTASAIAHAGFTAVSLANNHTDNFGVAGLAETKKYLTDAKVGYFGDPWNSDNTELIIKKNNMSIAFVGYHAFQGGFDTVIASIKRLKAGGNYVIVMPHWGEEYEDHPSELTRDKARLMVAAGADAIIGSHPHVIQEHEWIDGVPVFYSLGNLLFDQYFSAAVMKGNIVELNLSKADGPALLDSVHVYETSTASKKGVTVEETAEQVTE